MKPCHNAAMTKIDRTPTRSDFSHVTEWVFDLDNTLYPHHVNLFAQIDKNMTAYVSALLRMERDEARKLQKQYYLENGTTMQGLMIHHVIDPNDLLEKAHEIDVARAEAAKKRAEERVAQPPHSDQDFERARVALMKSLIRLQVASRARTRA